MTCSEAEVSQCTPSRGTVNIGASQRTDSILEEETLAEADISGSIPKAKKTRSGDERDLKEEDLFSSTSEVKNPDHGRNQPLFCLRWLDLHFHRHNPRASANLSVSHKVSSQREPLVDPHSSSHQAAASRDVSAPAALPQDSGKIRNVSGTAKTSYTANDLGHKNLAELYARFDKAKVEKLQAEPLEIDAQKAHDQDMTLSASIQAFEKFEKMQCQFCGLHFTPEQNVRELDNGSSPCSHHPGKTYARNFHIFVMFS